METGLGDINCFREGEQCLVWNLDRQCYHGIAQQAGLDGINFARVDAEKCQL